MAKPLSDKSNLTEGNKTDAKETASTPTKTPQTQSSTESKPQKTKNKLINKLSLTGISTSSSSNHDTSAADKVSNKENGKNGKKAVSAQNSQELASAESPPPVQVQKKKKLSFRQRLSRCGSGCKNKITKKNSNEMELENVSSSNNDLTGGQKPTSTEKGNSKMQPDQAIGSPKPVDENDVDINSPTASNAKAANNQNNQNVDANHCARNFFCWCCSCCSCLK